MAEIMQVQQTEEMALEVVPVSALESITKGEIDVQIATAQRYPRSLAGFRKRALEMATLDEETAESCFYVLPRGGKKLEGPGIRLAEIVASAYKHLRIAGRVIDIGDKDLTAQGVVHDLESNVAYSVEVKRRILDKYGKRYNDDMIIVTGNAAISIAIRNAIFRIIPMAYIKPIYDAAKKIAVGDATTLVQRRAQAIDYYAKLGVSVDQILARLERSGVEEISLDDLTALTGLKTAIKEGSISVDEAFPPKVDIRQPIFRSQTTEPAPAVARPTPPPATVDPTDPLGMGSAPPAEQEGKRK